MNIEEKKINFKNPYIIIVLIVGFVLGIVFGYYYFSPRSYQKGFDEAKSIVEQSELGKVISAGVSTLHGTVEKINGNSVIINTNINDPFLDKTLSKRTIIIASSTAITELVPKNPALSEAEVNIFANNLNKTPPSLLQGLFKQNRATMANIEVGSYITVSASKNIKNIKEFTASSIQIEPVLDNFNLNQ